MFRRQLLTSSLLLFSVAARAQTGDISSPATPGAGDPSLVPLSDTNVSVRTAAVPTNTADQEGKINFVAKGAERAVRSKHFICDLFVLVKTSSYNESEMFFDYRRGHDCRCAIAGLCYLV